MVFPVHLRPRWRTLFLLLFILLVSLTTRAQRLRFSVSQAPLAKVFLLIEQQTGYSFFYSREMLDPTHPVTLTVQDEALSSVLEKCFRDQPLIYEIEEKHIVVKVKPVTSAPAAILTDLRGRVVNEEGSGVGGVTVSIKGTTQSIATDASGNFQFSNVPAKVTLQISGAEIESQEIYVTSNLPVLIRVVKKIGALDEAIVIAYGKSTQRYATSSVSTLSAEKLQRQPVSDPLLALTGNVSGLRVTQSSGVPGSYLTVRLRGQNSIANGNDPLYVVDGVPFPSTSLNGAFGGPANGALSPLDNINPNDIQSIEVLKDAGATAIYGSRGANGVILITTKKGVSGKPSINLKYYSGIGEGSRRMDLLSTPDYLRMRREAFANDQITPDANMAPDLLLWDTTRYTDWQKVLLGHTVHLQDLQGSVTGGSEFTQFLVSGTYRHETTVYPGDFGAKKLSGFMQLSHRSPDNTFTLSFSSALMRNVNVGPREDLAPSITLPPNAPELFNPDGSLNWSHSTWTNPWGKVLSPFTSTTTNLQSNLTASLVLPAHFGLTFSGGYNRIQLKEQSSLPAAANDPVYGAFREATFGNRTIETLIGEPQLTYRRFWSRHTVDALVGASIQQTSTDALYQLGSGFASDELLTNISSAGSVRTRSEEAITYRYVGAFARLNYDFFKKYLFSATVRRDGSSRYGPATRFSNFGSAALGWVFSSEPFAKRFQTLSFGKLLLTGGVTGNDQIGDYKFMDLYRPYTSPYQGQTTFAPVQLFNPNYSWEQVKKWELGLDLGFWKDRLLLSSRYYHHVTSNQLVQYPLPAATGFGAVIQNIPARILNTGWEIDAKATVIKSKRFQWSSNFTLSVPRNKLLSFENLATSSYGSFYVLGEPLSIVKTFQFTGLDRATGLYTFTDYDRDSYVGYGADQQYIVRTGSRYFGGLENTLKFDRWSLSLLFNFNREPYGLNYLGLFGKPGSRSNQPVAVLDHWQQPGDAGPFQQYSVYGSAPSDAFGRYYNSSAAYSDASFIRLRNVYLSYALPPKVLNPWGIQQLSFFMQGQNLLLITHYQGLDPETKSYTPPVRLLTGGLSVTF